METKKTNTEKSQWDEYWAQRIDEYYRTSRYTGD